MYRVRRAGRAPPGAGCCRSRTTDRGRACTLSVQALAGGAAIKTLLNIVIISGALMALLGLLRIPFAVRFWRKAQWVGFA